MALGHVVTKYFLMVEILNLGKLLAVKCLKR